MKFLSSSLTQSDPYAKVYFNRTFYITIINVLILNFLIIITFQNHKHKRYYDNLKQNHKSTTGRNINTGRMITRLTFQADQCKKILYTS